MTQVEPLRGSTERIIAADIYRRHFSAFLKWHWHFQDFSISNVRVFQDQFAMTADLVPCFGIFLRITQFWRRHKNRLGLPTTIRVANHAAIVASGLLLDLPRKGGDVIAEQFSIRCAAPILYGASDRIPIRIKLHSLTESSAFFVYNAEFSVGQNAEHAGAMIHHYTKARHS